VVVVFRVGWYYSGPHPYVFLLGSFHIGRGIGWLMGVRAGAFTPSPAASR
jgi:hypothetical protein